MLTAASVMISGSLWPGTSITKQWLMRRAVAVRRSCSFFSLQSGWKGMSKAKPPATNGADIEVPLQIA